AFDPPLRPHKIHKLSARFNKTILRGGDRSRFASCILRRGRCGGNSRHRLARSLSWVNSLGVFPPAFVIRLPRRSLGEGGSFACQVVASRHAIALREGWLAKAGASSFVCMSFAASLRFRSSDRLTM